MNFNNSSNSPLKKKKGKLKRTINSNFLYLILKFIHNFIGSINTQIDNINSSKNK